MSMSMSGVQSGYTMVRDAKKDVIRPSDLEATLKLEKDGGNKRSDIDDPVFKKLVKDYGTCIKNGSKGKILEKIIFEDGSCYYVVKGSNFKDGRSENVLNKIKKIIRKWKTIVSISTKIYNTNDSYFAN